MPRSMEFTAPNPYAESQIALMNYDATAPRTEAINPFGTPAYQPELQDPFGLNENSFSTASQFQNQESIPDGRPPLSERLANQIGRVKQVGGKALELVMGGMLGSKMSMRANQVSNVLNFAENITSNYGTLRQDTQNAYANRDQLKETVKTAGKASFKEVVGAGLKAGGHDVLNSFGLETRTDSETGKERIGIASKRQLGRAGLALYASGGAKIAAVGVSAFKEGMKAAGQESVVQLNTHRSAAQEASYNYFGNMAA